MRLLSYSGNTVSVKNSSQKCNLLVAGAKAAEVLAVAARARITDWMNFMLELFLEGLVVVNQDL
jgi:hypothetical protein